MACIVGLTTARTLPDSDGSVVLAWAAETLNSDAGMHVTSTGNTKITVVANGVYNVSAMCNFAGNAAGHREVTIRKNGVTVMASQRVPAVALPAGAPRGTVVQVALLDVARVGDYYEVLPYQTSGGNLQVTTNVTQFSVALVGERIGVGGGILFDSAFRYKGISNYDGITNGQNFVLVDDPLYGPARRVMKVTTHNADDQQVYPRSQVTTPSTLSTSTADVYIGLSVYVPTDLADMSGLRSPVIHEVYGPPFGGYGPNVLRIRDNKFALEPIAIYATTTGAATGARHSWSLPLTGLKGKWVDFVHRVKLSTDPAVGLHQLWVDLKDGNGLVQQTLTKQDGTTAGTTLNLATVIAGTNDGGSNFSSLKVAYTDYSIGAVSLYYTQHKVATTLADATPLLILAP